LETGYLNRVKEEDRRLNAGVQLNIFNHWSNHVNYEEVTL
jgi:hypothetical protein